MKSSNLKTYTLLILYYIVTFSCAEKGQDEVEFTAIAGSKPFRSEGARFDYKYRRTY
jgi:hypothetical protein